MTCLLSSYWAEADPPILSQVTDHRTEGRAERHMTWSEGKLMRNVMAGQKP